MANTYPPDPSMGLSLPIPLVDPGPQYAIDINSAFLVVASHTHLPGSGQPITPAAMNINAAINMQSNNLSFTNAVNLNAQASTISGVALVNNVGGNLYWNNGSGTAVQITNGNSIVGTSGSIGGLPSSPPGAAVTYGAGSYTFVSAANTPAAIIGGPITFSNPTAGGNGITFQAPVSLASAFAITWPSGAPSTLSLMSMSTGPTVGYVTPDGTTIEISGSTLEVVPGGIGSVQLAPANAVISTTASGTVNATGSFTTITNMVTPSITITGANPVVIELIPAWAEGGSVDPSQILTTGSGYLQFQLRANSVAYQSIVIGIGSWSPSMVKFMFPASSLSAGAYVFDVQWLVGDGATAELSGNCYLSAYEVR